ncbi:MAG: M28 family peptidase [Clostridiales bacterium]|jgi:hypothetical protein|nr:M28 family peptidase [Clostridiales bacterium]
MKKRFILAGLAVAALMVFASCAHENGESAPHGTIAYGFLEYIEANFPNRIAYTQRERDVADWIVRELIAMGHSSDNIIIQEFGFTDAAASLRYLTLNFSEGDLDMWENVWNISSVDAFDGIELLETSQNVILTVPGQSERKIIIGAHYDSVFTTGISDNGSGIVMLLESASRILDLDNYYTIVYVFFGSEEVDIIGSQYFVDSLTPVQRENVVLAVNIDIIFNGHDITFGAGFRDENGEEAQSEITLLLDSIAERINAEHGLELVRQPGGSTLGSDNLSFLGAGFDTLVLYSLEGWDPFEEMFGPIFWTQELLDLVEALLNGENVELDEDINDALLQLATTEHEEWGFMIEDHQLGLGMEENREIPGFVEKHEAEIVAFERILTLIEHPNFQGLMATVEIPEFVDEEPQDEQAHDGPPSIGAYLHTNSDNMAFINETWPGLIERALRNYSIFLEEIKLIGR